MLRFGGFIAQSPRGVEPVSALWVYEPDTRTVAAIYATASGDEQLANPVLADSNGLIRAIYFQRPVDLVLKSERGVILWSLDDAGTEAALG